MTEKVATYAWESLFHEGCTSQIQKERVSGRHGAYKTIATFIGKAETSLQTIKGCETTVKIITNAQGSGIDAHNHQANAGHAAISRESPSILPSVIVPTFTNVEKIGAWVYWHALPPIVRT
jgi:hypothetical protein